MAFVEIQGIQVKYRDLRESSITEEGELIEGEEILYADLIQDDQYFRRVQVPFNDEEIIAIANKEHQYSNIQKDWVDREKKRMNYGEGVYCMINGELTYIPASYWGYINHWTLEDGTKPEYREDDRVFFLFMEFLYFETDVLGVTRGKGRRQGATTIGTFWLWWICGRNPEKKGGLISFNTESAQKIFQFMFMRGFKEMLPCFVEDFDSDSDNFIRFVKPVEKKKKGVPIKREGLNSYVDYLSTTINSYDSGSLHIGVFDESGKYEKMDINTYWSKVSPTLKKGRLKVGFAYLPTTVNPKKKGGENYKKFWRLCDQNAINPKTGQPFGLNTPNKVVRYLVPATRGYAGCIDKFGKSIVEDPATPVMGNDGKWITEGALSIIQKERALLEGEQLMEHRRDFPLDEFDMFSFEAGNCEFNQNKLVERIYELDQNPVYLRKIRLTDNTTIEKSTVPGVRDKKKREIKYMDDENSYWLLYEEPEKPNDFSNWNDIFKAKAAHKYVVGADTIRIFSAEHGSMATICVFKKSCVINGIETGNYPVAFYVGRPKTPSLLYEEIIKICLWYGCRCNIERSAGDHFVEYFYQAGCDDLLLWTPARNPNKPGQAILAGTESASPFQVSMQLECAKVYFDGTDPISYNGNIHRVVFKELLQQALEYDHSERTPYDLVIALMMCLVAALRAPEIKTTQIKPTQLLPTYKLAAS